MTTRRFIAAALAAGTVLTLSQISFVQAAPVQAAPDAGQQPGGRMHGRMQKMAEELGLTEDQKAKIKPIMQAQRQKMEAMRADTTLTPEAKRAQMKATMESTQTQIKAILTPDQQKKWDAMRAQMKAQHQERTGQ